MRKSLWRLLPVLALCLVAAAKKESGPAVRFYTEVQAREGDPEVLSVQFQFPPHKGFVAKVPAISERDVREIYLFSAGDGSAGCSFFLGEHGKAVLDTLSIEKRGMSLVAAVNGRQVIDLLIDRRVSDGIITIPRGLTLPEAALLKKSFREVKVPAPKQQ